MGGEINSCTYRQYVEYGFLSFQIRYFVVLAVAKNTCSRVLLREKTQEVILIRNKPNLHLLSTHI